MSALIDWLFVDRRTGRIVIGQKPNGLMLVVIAATVARLVLSAGAHRDGAAGTAIRSTQAAALFLWALDELLRGVNPFRRLGGAALLVGVPFRRMLH